MLRCIVLCSPLVRRGVAYDQSKTRGLHRGVFIESGIDVSAPLGSDLWEYLKTTMNTNGTPKTLHGAIKPFAG